MNDPRRFHLLRKDNHQFIVSGVVFPDNFVVVRWNATDNIAISRHGTSTYESIEWFLAVHGREGDAVIHYLDH